MWRVTSLPKGKILDWANFKAFSDNKSNVAKVTIFFFDKPENIVGKGENASYLHFLLSFNVFKNPIYQGSSKPGVCGKDLRVNRPMCHIQ